MAKRRGPRGANFGRRRTAKATPRPKTSKPARRSRVNTIHSNGDQSSSMEVAPETVSVGEAMRQAVKALGDVKIDNDLAPAQLRAIGEAYEEVVRRGAAFNAKREEAVTAKKSLEAAQEILNEKVRASTHPTPLPLFDTDKEESDREAMINSATPTPEPQWSAPDVEA